MIVAGILGVLKALYRWLAAEVVTAGIAKTISASAVRRILAAKSTRVLDLYNAAGAVTRSASDHLLSSDALSRAGAR